MATTGVVNGTDLRIYKGGTAIGRATTCSLSISREMREILGDTPDIMRDLAKQLIEQGIIMRDLAKQLIEQGIAVPFNPARGKLTEKQQTAQIVNENKPQPNIVVVPLPANTGTKRKNNSDTKK